MNRFLSAYRIDGDKQILAFTVMVHDVQLVRELLTFMQQYHPELRWAQRVSVLNPRQVAPTKPFDFLKPVA